MKNILLTGASGFLGGNFCQFYKNIYNISAVFYNNPINVAGINVIKADLSNAHVSAELLKKTNFDFVIHLAACSDPNFCELNEESAYKNNVQATENIAHICRELKIPLLFASTDLVFDGENAPYTESDKTSPIMAYGRQKAMAENIVLEASAENNLVARLPLLYGNTFNAGKSFIQPMIEKLANKQEVFLFTDEYRTVASARAVCEGIALLIERNCSGVYHLGGNESLSRFEMGEILCDIYGFDKKYLKPSLQKDVKMPAARPKDVSLNNHKMLKLGWHPGTFKEQLQRIAAKPM